MEAEYDIEVEGPVVYVYETDETYDSMYNELLVLDKMMRKNNKIADRKSPLERLISDILGGVFIYFGTFILCDLIRTFREGEWTPLYWSIWGPYRYLTGAPLIKKIIGRYRDNHDTLTCKQGYDALSTQCSLYDKAYDSGSADSVVDQGKQLKTNIVNELILLGLPIVYDYTGNSGIEACNEISEIYLIRCQNKGLQGDTREMMCQRQADNWMKETLTKAEQNYTVDWLLAQWLDQYNSCLAKSIDPPDRNPSKQKQCLDANDEWLQKCNSIYYDTNECQYIYDNNKKACSGDVDSIYGCSEYYKAYSDCVANAKDPENECGNIKADLKWCENFEYQYADPNVRLT